MSPPTRIGLVFTYNLAYPRGVLRGIKQYAQSRPDWILMPYDVEGFTAKVMQAMQPAGLISNVFTPKLAELFQSVRRPVVNVGSVLRDLPFPRVCVDHKAVGKLACHHLVERGFRHFAFVGHPNHLYSTEREAGFRTALAKARQTYQCYYERPSSSYVQRGRLLVLRTGFQNWLRTLPKPVGVFTCHDVWALQVVEGCRLAGLRVPDDVSVVGVDNDDLLCELARPSLSSVIVPAERIGFQAAALLERLMKHARAPRRPQFVPPTGVIARQSSDVLAGSDPVLTEAMRFIRDRAHLPLSVEDVLREIPISRRALEQRFRTILERGIGEEIRRVHVERAKELLATTMLSVGEVAERAGFASVHYLSRVFHHDVGLTPTEFRGQVRNPAIGTKPPVPFRTLRAK